MANEGLYNSTRTGIGAFDFYDGKGHIGAFYLGPLSVNITEEPVTLTFSIDDPIVYAGTGTTVTPFECETPTLRFAVVEPNVEIFNNVEVDFTATPRCGAVPLDVSFSATVQFSKEYSTVYQLSSIDWYFDYNNDNSFSATSTEYTTSAQYISTFGDKFDIKADFNFILQNDSLSGTYDPHITYSKTRTEYITTCGLSEVRYGTNKLIDLKSYLPYNKKDTEVESFVGLFEDFLNEMFDGINSSKLHELGYTVNTSASNDLYYNVERGTSATNDIITHSEDVAELYYDIETNKKISILEKINRITEMHDPDHIDLNYINYFANYLGYSVDLNRDDIGENLGNIYEYTETPTCCDSVAKEKYLRNMISNLPNWYKIKSSRNAIRTMLYTFGLIGDIVQYYTKDYKTSWQPDINHNVVDSNINKDYYPTPHYSVYVDVEASNNAETLAFERYDKVLRAIESLRPVNNVFDMLVGTVTGQQPAYLSGMMKMSGYFRII